MDNCYLTEIHENMPVSYQCPTVKQTKPEQNVSFKGTHTVSKKIEIRPGTKE